MDEPLSNFDAKLRIEARSFLTKMHQEIGVTTVYVTHDQSEAMTMGDTIVVMKDGVIQQAAPPLEVYNEPANAFVAGFIGSPAMNFIELSVAGAKLVDPENGLAIAIPDRLRGSLAGYGKAKVMLGVRPEALRPLPRNADANGAARLSIDVVQHLGHETLLDASSGPHRIVARVSAADDSRLWRNPPVSCRRGAHASVRIRRPAQISPRRRPPTFDEAGQRSARFPQNDRRRNGRGF